MISETTPLNQWSKSDLLKLQCVIEMIHEKEFLPMDWIDWSNDLQSAINQALKDVEFESKRLPI